MDIIGQLLITNERRQKALFVQREQLCLSAYKGAVRRERVKSKA